MSSVPTSPDTALDRFSLHGKVVVLTGASSGLGHRFARALGHAGATVVLAARRADRLAPLVEELPDAVAVPCDLTADGAPAELVATTLDRCGQIDVVVNNAGISRVLAAVDDDLDDFRRELEINLVAPYELSRLAARTMLDAGRGGSIVNIGSVMGHGGGGRLRVPGYAASKGGLHNLTRELASQWARKGVRVNGIGAEHVARHLRLEPAGSDAIDPHALAGPLGGQLPGQ
ncbi:MAG: SDR family NAD(P)-dependent oxidoreductase, partial [Actinomycetota bacterium]